jgi:ubiquinone/menaquinone biosynthesis C-methylase UbiE
MVRMERATVDVYERRAADWLARRPARYRDDAVAFSRRCLPGRPAVDLGAGPGSYLADLGRPLVALDAAAAMLELARHGAPDVPVVQADLEALPFRRGALGGGWARASYLHVPRLRLPLALARLRQ